MGKISTSEIICPRCGGSNPADAVFCQMPECHKALGEFDFADELVTKEMTKAERIADRLSTFIGKPHFVTMHLVWFILWALLNSGLIAAVAVFDVYPYSLLGIILSIEATLITSVLLISNNRQNAYADKRAQLDYEVNVKAFRLMTQISKTLDGIEKRVATLEQQRH